MPVTSSRFNIVTTVVDAATSYDLASLAVVKAELGETTTDAARDTVLKSYISSASASAQQYCNRVFAVETIQDSFFPKRDRQQVTIDGADPLQLTRWPIVDITSVTEAGNALTRGVDYLLDAENGALIRLDAVGYPRNWEPWPIVVVYDAGFETIPADVSDAVIQMVSRRWFIRGRDPMVRREGIAGVSDVSYFADADVANNLSQQILDKYRAAVVA